ncbi:MAG TPA: hypothetical protein VIS06_11995 [Mycobacteriales bacterium]
MFDEVQMGWLAGDDYARAVEAAGVVELPMSDESRLPEPEESDKSTEADESCPVYRDVLDELVRDRCRWEDDNPPGVGR